ncbi:flavin reductase family protein [Bacillus pinisoli]|uniref:flavin reductase family protein n=1 Tax=Bacillus pinisoli TaxID=2901866 RepID=UPI001FF453F9|nr:flavin reductase family protein [Bacillus pinisoli]
MLRSRQETVMHSYPGMVALVTSSSEGKENIMAAGWHSYISYEPAIYGVAIAKERYSHSLISSSKEFGINFIPGHLAAFIQESGTLSGHEENKLAKLNYIKGETIDCPILSDAYVAYECKVIDQRTYGDHDWIVGEITRFHKDDSKFLDNGLPNFTELTIPLYVGRSQYLMVNNKVETKNFYNK